ncbi:hypothetical protein MMPV_001283 [Pyropia vietnamensis]
MAAAATAAVMATVVTARTPPPPPPGVYPSSPQEALTYDTYAYPKGWTPPRETPPPYVSACYWEEHQSDDTLYWRLTEGRTIGGCYIQTGSAGVCSLYAKSAVPGATGDRGHPKNRNNMGTGCVGNDNFCFFRRAEYDLTDAERDDMCTADRRHNAVAQIRHAMRNGACGNCKRKGW